MMTKLRRSITWDEEVEAAAEKIVAHYANEMRLRDILPYTAARPSGEKGMNISGVVQFALLKLAEQIEDSKNE